MRVKGQITVFVSLSMLCVFALLCGLLESARTAGARLYLQTAMSSSLDSVFSQYHRELWDSYRLLFAEYEDEAELAADFDQFLLPYLQTENWYPMTHEATKVEEFLTAVDDNGAYLEQEILDYMKYGIWNLEFEGEEVKDLWKREKEAVAVTTVAEDYRRHAKAALKLEKALESISENLERQSQWRDRGVNALERYDERDFRRQGEALIGELKKMPGLVDAYSRQADALERDLQRSRKEFSLQQADMEEEVEGKLDREIQGYESYVEQNGAKRQEIQGLKPKAIEQIPWVESVMEEAREVQQIIDDWEYDDEDDDGPDLEALWRPVARRFASFSISELSFSHGVKDKEKEGWINGVIQLGQSNLLNMVMPEGATISKGGLNTQESPSQTVLWTPAGREVSLANHLLINAYCGQFFSNAIKPKEGVEDKGQLIYELEYLLEGADLDEKNLGGTVTRLLMVREGLNLIHILSDGQKRDAAGKLAMVITGVAGLTPLVALTTFFIMSVWALGEAMADIRGLLEGKKVPLWKTQENWTLSLDGLLVMGRQGEGASGGGGTGFSYESWLKLLLIMEDAVTQEYRMMDLIQMNLRQKQESFRMRRSVYQVQLSSLLQGKHVFFSLGFVDGILGNPVHTYPMKAVVERVY